MQGWPPKRNHSSKSTASVNSTMAFKICVLFALVAAAQAGVISAPAFLQAAPLAVAKVATIDPNYDPNPQYSYSYSVQDALTGDSKTSEETRSGDVVQGSYSLVEPDGTLRTVRYTADPVNGFNAVVEKSGAAIAAAPVVKKIVQAAPQLIHTAPQLIRAAPQLIHTAPQYIHAAPQYIQTAPQLLRAAPQLIHAAPQQILHAAPALLKTAIAPQISTAHVVTNHAAYGW